MITIFNIRPKGFNIGNDAIGIALRNQVFKAFGRIVNIIDLPATSHYESHSKAGLTAKTINEINRYGDGVIIGGGNLYENNELALDVNALKHLRVPLMLFSLSRGKVYNRRLELCERTDTMPDASLLALNKAAQYSLARDSTTKSYLDNLGCVGVKLGYCPTIFLSDLNSNLARLPDAEVPGVLISIRTPSLMNIPLRLQSNIQAEIESIIDDLRSRGFGRIRILCNDSRDIEFATVFQGTKKVDYVYTADVYGYLSLLKEAELVISYRLHASLPCLSFGTPVVMLSYDERASSLIEDLGFGDWDINLTEGSTIKNVQSRLDNIDNLTELRKKTNALWDSISDIQHKEMKNFSEEVVSYARSSHAIYSKF
jgi:hypothetical protein